jgi:hypothetical protein
MWVSTYSVYAGDGCRNVYGSPLTVSMLEMDVEMYVGLHLQCLCMWVSTYSVYAGDGCRNVCGSPLTVSMLEMDVEMYVGLHLQCLCSIIYNQKCNSLTISH